MHLTDKVSLITGSGRGIGRQIALNMAKAGAKIIVSDIDGKSAEATAELIREGGGEAIVIVADVSSSIDVEKLIKRSFEHYKRIDILVNNAGITRDALLLRMKEADWDDVLTINLKSIFLCTQKTLRIMMKQRSGVIINIASVVGLMGNIGQANYAAAKGGVVAFTKTVAKEAAARGIRCNAVAPGFIETPMTDKLSDAVKEKTIGSIPLARFGKPDDIANMVTFLASDHAAYVTGQILNVDGGLIM